MLPRLLVLLALTVLFPGLASADDVFNRATARGTLIAAAVPDQLPLAARTASGELEGFDIDVAKAIAGRLGLPVRFVDADWETLLKGDWGDSYDYSVSSMTPTVERARHLDFPAIYRFEPAVLLVRIDETSIQKPADASGRKIGVKEKTTYQSYLEHNLVMFKDQGKIPYLIKNPRIETYPDKEGAFQALVTHDVDATITSWGVAQDAIKNGLPVRQVQGFLFFEPVAVAIAKGDPDFSNRIESAVLSLGNDGTLSNLSMKWFGIDLSKAIP